MKVKGLEFSILIVGHISCDKNWNIALHDFASKSKPNLSATFWEQPFVSILIKHPDVGYFLFDTGCSLLDLELRTPYQQETFAVRVKRDEFIDKQLEKAGLSVNDISAIVLSHLHWDHADGVTFFKGTKAIQHVYSTTVELQDALVYTHGGPEFNEEDQIFRKHMLDLPDIRYHLIDKDTEIFPGVHVITLEGHTRGCMGMMLELEGGTYIFPGDAIYTPANFGPPARAPGIVKDTAAFFRCAEKVRKLQKKFDATIVYSHDPEIIDKFKLAPYFYI